KAFWVSNGARRSTRRGANREKIGGLERSPADQTAVDVRLREQLGRIVRLDAAAIKNLQRTRNCSIRTANFVTDEGVHLLGLRGRGRASGPDGPDRLVGDHGAGQGADAHAVDDRVDLGGDDLARFVR